MKRYETPQATEVGEAQEVVLGAKDQLMTDNGGTPTQLWPNSSIVDSDE